MQTEQIPLRYLATNAIYFFIQTLNLMHNWNQNKSGVVGGGGS